MNPSAFLFNQIAEPITNQSVAGLQVPNGQSLLLLGGDMRLEGGQLRAPGGRVELGGVAGAGLLGLNVDSNNLRLSFPGGVARADVSLANGSRVNVSAGGGGSIAVNARNLNISGVSRLATGIGAGLGAVGSKAGNIEIDATDKVAIDGTSSTDSSSVIANAVLGSGNAGDIVINTGSLDVIGNSKDRFCY